MCKIEQPILCFLDIDMPVPAALSRPEYWTGGVLALSSPVRGSRFTRISDANAYCAATKVFLWPTSHQQTYMKIDELLLTKHVQGEF